MKAFLRRLYARLISPVPQNPDAVIFGRHGDAVVQLRPVIDADGVIVEWLEDPEDVALADEADASTPPAIPTAPPACGSAPPPLPPNASCNPASVPGL